MAAASVEPAPAIVPSTKPWSWAGCTKTIDGPMTLRCPALVMRIAQVAQQTPPTDAMLEQAERESLEKSGQSFNGKYPDIKGTLNQVMLDLGAGKKVPRSVLSFPETAKTNPVAYHALAIPGSVGEQKTIVIYTCTAKVNADCDAALVDVVTKGPPRL
jgi:hypothetical protein